MTLTEFLLARIAEDETAARAAVTDEWSTGGFRMIAQVPHDPNALAPGWILVEPRHALAECEAKRRIVEMFSGNLHEKWDDGHEAGKMVAPILSAVALPYADHPDYREEWKP